MELNEFFALVEVNGFDKRPTAVSTRITMTPGERRIENFKKVLAEQIKLKETELTKFTWIQRHPNADEKKRYSVKFGNDAYPVGPNGKRYIYRSTFKEAHECLKVGEVLIATNEDFIQTVQNYQRKSKKK